ncbi:MAG: 2'-5' RNA ligase family protein [Nostoc sp. CmiVER01]|uniref:2'-5' RNA ligase family protein n=1 Tax=Nostoc sp. CmiVER01 TaxID=3075384 RepID=UPI002AD1F3B9|nr:2'-5' RNA ligase family protein [Nostoc sp. CmiVER01]MDZ8122144.1 2'-5' RNA ligase family protein [Nostoc sp. CmiVER01]
MSYAIVHYPNISTEDINQIRQKYDPQVYLIEPHITLVSPIIESINENNLILHIDNILSKWKTFPICFKGLQKSWDEYLFLMVEEGKADMIKLHNELYTGILAKYCRNNLLFIPHLTLGIFTNNIDQFLQVLEEAQQLNLNYHCFVDKVHLINIADEQRSIIWSKEFVLRN